MQAGDYSYTQARKIIGSEQIYIIEFLNYSYLYILNYSYLQLVLFPPPRVKGLPKFDLQVTVTAT